MNEDYKFVKEVDEFTNRLKNRYETLGSVNHDIKTELTDTLVILSCGLITFAEAESLANAYAAEFDLNKLPQFGNKGLKWFAEQILKMQKHWLDLFFLIAEKKDATEILAAGYTMEEYERAIESLWKEE